MYSLNGRLDVERQIADELVQLLVARLSLCLTLLAFEFVLRLGGEQALQTPALGLLAASRLSDVRVVHRHVLLVPLSLHPLVLRLRLRDQLRMLLLRAEQPSGCRWLLVNRLRRVHESGHRRCRGAVLARPKWRMIYRRYLQ